MQWRVAPPKKSRVATTKFRPKLVKTTDENEDGSDVVDLSYGTRVTRIDQKELFIEISFMQA